MKTRHIQLGTFYGYRFNLEVPKNQETMPDEWFVKQFIQSIESIKKHAVEQYKDKLYFEQLEKRNKENEPFLFKLR